MSESGEITRWLEKARSGELHALERIVELVYPELRILARRQLRDSGMATLTPTALVHEAYLRILGDREQSWASRAQFFAAAAEAMRRILIEQARSRGTKRRGGDRARVPLNALDFTAEHDLDQVLAVDEAIQKLGGADPRSAEIVRLRFYAGLGEQESAAVIGVSARTIRREWHFARAWLLERLQHVAEP